MSLKGLLGFSERYNFKKGPMYDRFLLFIVFFLLAVGLVVVYTASISFAEKSFHDSLYFVKRQLFCIVLGLGIGFLVINIPARIYAKLGESKALAAVTILCIVTACFGVEIKGARRWINLVVFNFQAAELLKLVWIVYLAGYIQRHQNHMTQIWQAIKPILFLCFFVIIVGVYQRDFGTCAILFAITFTLLFLSGLKIKHVLIFLAGSGFLGCILILTQSYRVQRFVSYLDPWKYYDGSSYQLTMSLMALGRGEIEGQGLGNSVIKLEYLPDAHTDFVTAIWGEETGMIGMLLILLFEFLMVYRVLLTGITSLKSETNRDITNGLICVGIGIWLLTQVFINIGSAIGLTPTKGLTLPLISYGGSSLLMILVALSMVIRISYERRLYALMEKEANIRVAKAKRKKNKDKEKDLNQEIKENTSEPQKQLEDSK
ncbi:MAG: putative lipid II flippase FtsW [Ruminobacter sp.]|nr:putative lipid II flippase FtsW [Ruminobacter sp.]